MEHLPMNANERWLMIADSAEKPAGLAFLIGLHIVICCISLIDVSYFKYHGSFDARAFHIFYDPARLFGAVAMVAAFALVSFLFLFARFSFGYFIGFYLYTMVLGYLWLNYFSDLNYDHWLAGLSAAVSAIAFLLPALLISSPIRQTYVLSAQWLDRLLAFILVLAVATIAISAIYNFRLVAIERIYDYRDKLQFPTLLNYSIGMTSSTLLPFAFACFAARRNLWRAAATLFLLLLLYPIVLSKLVLFTPAWLVTITLLAWFFQARTAVVLSLLLPMLAGIVTFLLKTWPAFFYIVNFRMVTIPSTGMDVYNHYFSDHDLTYFCQIWFLKPLVSCPYPGPLSLVMESVYHLGNFNASLFATEGVASVGPMFAPVSALLCGVVIAFANRLSAGLPARFILTSSAVLPQVFLNVPMTTTLLTHGAALLFLLWYITPRAMFEQKSTSKPPLRVDLEGKTSFDAM
jgi:hypothetical protein